MSQILISKYIIKGLIADIVIIGSLKLLVRRPRPRQNLTKEMALGTNSGPDKYSFPSGHSSRAILCSNLLTQLIISQELFSNRMTQIGCVLFLNMFAYVTCLSRLLLNRHFFMDVVAGILTGHMLFLGLFVFVSN